MEEKSKTYKNWIIILLIVIGVGGMVWFFNRPPTSCEIKGNISSDGEKIYHMKGQKYYDVTKIDKDKGEKWFCTEKEAEDDGWRKSKI